MILRLLSIGDIIVFVEDKHRYIDVLSKGDVAFVVSTWDTNASVRVFVNGQIFVTWVGDLWEDCS